MSDRKLRRAISLFAGTCLLPQMGPGTGSAADRVARSRGQTL